MKTLVLGMGNPILSDDGVGIKVAREVGKQLNSPQVTVAETSEAGLSLLDSIVGYDKVIIIDAIQTKEGNTGQIYRMGPQDFSSAKYLSSPHQINLATALELGKMLDLAMPQKITIFTVEAKDVTNFSEKCTPEVEKAIPEVVKMVLQELNAKHPPEG
jgi:hydrogenase maturation protease